VALAQFLGAVFEEADKRAVDVSEAEEAEVLGADSGVLDAEICKVSRFQGFKVSRKQSVCCTPGSLKP
jgi:hypothetical protein